ncbi:hypothetical protein [Mycobacterium sp. KBS0706]|uniref:hypothetical protein n=1 Tax=Mycobacterium sp. KBS0706 TaxID=2578109 RepID=UPI00163D8648
MAIIPGTAGNDSLNGTAFADTIDGLAGNDTLRGYGGNDILRGASARTTCMAMSVTTGSRPAGAAATTAMAATAPTP